MKTREYFFRQFSVGVQVDQKRELHRAGKWGIRGAQERALKGMYWLATHMNPEIVMSPHGRLYYEQAIQPDQWWLYGIFPAIDNVEERHRETVQAHLNQPRAGGYSQIVVLDESLAGLQRIGRE